MGPRLSQLAVRFFSIQIFSCQIFGWNCFDCLTFYCLISLLSDYRLSDFCHVRFFGRQIVWLFEFLLPDFPDETEHAGPRQCKAVQVTESVICEIWCGIRLLWSTPVHGCDQESDLHSYCIFCRINWAESLSLHALMRPCYCNFLWIILLCGVSRHNKRGAE